MQPLRAVDSYHSSAGGGQGDTSIQVSGGAKGTMQNYAGPAYAGAQLGPKMKNKPIGTPLEEIVYINKQCVIPPQMPILGQGGEGESDPLRVAKAGKS